VPATHRKNLEVRENRESKVELRRAWSSERFTKRRELTELRSYGDFLKKWFPRVTFQKIVSETP
jgi:hypothetical protein